MLNRAEHRRNATKNLKSTRPKPVAKIYALVFLICLVALLAGVWNLSTPSTAQGQTESPPVASPQSVAAPPAASLASFAQPQTPSTVSASPAVVPTSAVATSPRRETHLTLDLSQGGSEFDENLIVPASQQAVLADGRSRLVGLLKPGNCLRMSGQRLALVQEAQTSLYTPPTPEKPDKDGLTSHRVIGTVKHLADTLLYLRTPDELIKTTPEHPFFVHGKGWTQSGKLQQGNQIETASGQLVPVVSTQVRHERMMVYNLEVEGAHDFFVGKDKLLVHNGGDCVPTLSEAKKLIGAWAKDPVTGRRADSIRYHFGEHGGDDIWQYLRDARKASLNLKGQGWPVDGRTPDTFGYKVKGGGYIHVAPGGIISFGYQKG